MATTKPSVKDLTARFKSATKAIEDKFDREMRAAARESSPAMRKSMEKIANRHYEDAMKGVDGELNHFMKNLLTLEKQSAKK